MDLADTPARSELNMAPTSRIGEEESSIWKAPEYLKNARSLIGDGARIIGGVEDTDNQFPDCVAVGSADRWCCTGTLVARNVVVTAGHCQGACSVRVFFGLRVTGPGRVFKVKNAVRHPKYGQDGQHNDLTVLILEEDVKAVAPREIATTDAANVAKVVRVVGYGNTNPGSTLGYGVRRKVDVAVATADCSHDEVKYGCDPSLEMVAGAPFLDRDSCNGDSGGPAYVEVGGRWVLCGATSRATADSTRPCGDGGIYVRIDKYIDWIKSVPGGHW
jgi:secreted trypsin-like serine protease